MDQSKQAKIQQAVTSALSIPDLPPLFEQLRDGGLGAQDDRAKKFYDLVVLLLECHRDPHQAKQILKLKGEIEVFPEFERYLVFASAQFEPPVHLKSPLWTDFSKLLRDWGH